MGLEPSNFLGDFRQTKTSVVITEVIVLMVAHVHSNWNDLLAELARWKGISRGGSLLGYSTASH